MIEFNCKYPENIKAELASFECSICNFVTQRLDKCKPYRTLGVILTLSVDTTTDDKSFYTIEGNQCMALRNSEAFAGDIAMFLRNNADTLKAMLIEGTKLTVHLNFSPQHPQNVKEDNMQTKQKQEETYVYRPITPRYTLDKVILPEELKKEILEAMNIISYQDLIYNQWGFSKVDPIAKSVINFYGPPGTGKTMCAHAVANYLKRPLLALNYAEIESKYVGDAAKNLSNAFNTAKQTNSVMFFDEADSFLGKRIQNVSQGADQALNSLRSQMLILLEEFSGIVIFATNLVSNFDKAFESRILKHLKFELPNEDARKVMIRSMMPERIPVQTPFSDEDFLSFAKATEGLSGRELKSAILECMLNKASQQGTTSVFVPKDFVDAFAHKQEMMKQLREEETKDKKTRILNALARKQNAETQSESKSENNADIPLNDETKEEK